MREYRRCRPDAIGEIPQARAGNALRGSAWSCRGRLVVCGIHGDDRDLVDTDVGLDFRRRPPDHDPAQLTVDVDVVADERLRGEIARESAETRV
jgi:hypothetical protein